MHPLLAALAELVDAPDLGSGSERSESSSLLCRTVMKRFVFWSALALVALTLNSCLFGDDQSTPVLTPTSYLYRTSIDGVRDSLRYGDTIQVGDTLYGHWVLYGVYNNLLSFTMQANATGLDYRVSVDSTYAHLISQESKPEEGKLYFVKDVYYCPVTLHFIAKEKGDYTVTLTLASSADEKYSPQVSSYIQSIQ